jgi:hypothetical protein
MTTAVRLSRMPIDRDHLLVLDLAMSITDERVGSARCAAVALLVVRRFLSPDSSRQTDLTDADKKSARYQAPACKSKA